MVVVGLLVRGLLGKDDHESAVLKAWFLCTFLVFFIPRMPFAVHLLDGLFIAVGLLLAIQIKEVASRCPAFVNPVFRFIVLILLVWSLVPHLVFRRRAWNDGINLQTTKFQYPNTLSPVGESDAIRWLRTYGNPNDLAIASEYAPP